MTMLKTVLLIDDEADIREVTEIALGTVGGLTVHCCDNGPSGIEQARMIQPDLVLLDVMMPGMDGPETFRQLQGHPMTESIPVVFMTAKSLPDELQALLAMGSLGIVAKPFDPMLLAGQLGQIWDRRHE